jgi:putative intracellular protease/amidase
MAAILLVVPSWEVSEASLALRGELERAGMAVLTVDESVVRRVSVRPFDAVIILGADGDALLHLVQRAAVEHKLIAGIGQGVLPLARAELLEGEHAVCPPDAGSIGELERHGAVRVPGDVVDDGNGIITARGPEAALDVARRVVWRLGQDGDDAGRGVTA